MKKSAAISINKCLALIFIFTCFSISNFSCTNNENEDEHNINLTDCVNLPGKINVDRSQYRHENDNELLSLFGELCKEDQSIALRLLIYDPPPSTYRQLCTLFRYINRKEDMVELLFALRDDKGKNCSENLYELLHNPEYMAFTYGALKFRNESNGANHELMLNLQNDCVGDEKVICQTICILGEAEEINSYDIIERCLYRDNKSIVYSAILALDKKDHNRFRRMLMKEETPYNNPYINDFLNDYEQLKSGNMN